MQYQTKFQSPLGELQLISDGSALTHLFISEPTYRKC